MQFYFLTQTVKAVYYCTQETKGSEGTMTTQSIEMTQECSHASYLMIKDEHLSGQVIAHQTLAGSVVQMSTYQQMVFSDCVFYAVEFQNVIFKNCVFEGCHFDFSHMRKCQFINCSFVNCNWKASSIPKTFFEKCHLDSYLSQLLKQKSEFEEFSDFYLTTAA